MSFAQTISPWLGSNTFHVLVLICCLVLAFKLYFNAFSRRIFVTLQNHRLKTVLKRPGNKATVTIPAGATTVSYAENQKIL